MYENILFYALLCFWIIDECYNFIHIFHISSVKMRLFNVILTNIKDKIIVYK